MTPLVPAVAVPAMDAPAKAPHVEEGYRRLAVEPRKLKMLAQGFCGEQREGDIGKSFARVSKPSLRLPMASQELSEYSLDYLCRQPPLFDRHTV